MDLPGIVRALQQGDDVSLAIDTLLNYNHPLTAKEQQQLTAFLELQAEQREGGLKVDEPTEEIEQLRRRPLQQAFHPLMVLQCIMSAAKLPYLTKDHQRRLQKTVLPFVAAHTPLSMEEWYMAMCVAQVQLSVATSTTALRCAEELLRCAAPVVLRCPATVVSALHRQHPHMAVKVAPRKESATPKLKEMSGNDAEKLFMKLLAAVVRAYAVQHANSAKHSRREVPTPGERFPTCHAMRRVMGTLQRCINVSGGEASVSVPESAFFTAVATLSAVEVLALSLLAPWMPAMTKDLLAAAIKTDADEVLALLGGTRAVADVLRLAPTSSCADVLQYCLYTMGLTTTTEVQYRALLAILVALPVEETSAVFLERGKDAVAQLLHPFVANAKGLTPEVAKEVAPQVARLCTHMMMVSATEVRESTFIPLTTAVVQAAAYSLTSRCRAVPEKESVLRIIHAIFAQLPCSVMDRVPRKELVAVLNREISLPVAASMGQALRVASVLHLTAQVADGLRDAVRASAKEDEVRRALLVFLTEDEAVPEEVVASLVSGVLEDCVEVHTSRPDAFLALGLICSTNTERVRQLLPMLSSAEVLGQLQGCHEERMAAGRVASRLAAVGCFAPCAMLLTAPRGDVRLLMEDQLSTTMAKDPTTSLALWRAWVEEVFLLHKESSAALLCEDGSSLPAFVKLGQAVLHHLPQLYQRAAVKLLAELLMCCGHDHVQGADPGFFLAARQRRRYDGSGFGILRTSIFGRIFPGQADMLMEHAGEVMEVLCTSFTTSEHVSTAAARAVVLLLTKLSGEAASCVADQLLRAARTSMDFFVALNERDRAIAAECADAMWSYEEATLREQQLLKTYTERAPKGMSEDDFADLKKRDALALEKGRAALHADVAKRTLTLQRTARLHKTSLHTIRHLGQHGHFPLAAVATLYPYLQSCLNETTHPLVVKSLALDAVVGLLSRTPLAHLVEPMVLTVARLVDEKYLTAKDVSQIASLAQMLRVELQQMLPAPLVVLLTAFDQVAFKAGRGLNATSTTIPVATQHQLLGLLLQNIGQAHLPQPAVVLALLTTILQRFAPLYKSVQQGVQTLMPMVPSADLATIEAALLGGSDSVREVVAGSYQRFSHFDGNRRALVLAAIFMKDPATAVVRGMESVLADERWSWELLPSDWSDVLYYLQTFGQSSANALRIASLMADLFAAPTTTDEAQHAWLAEIIAINGVAAVVAVQTLSPALRGACPVAVMSYLSTLIEQPTTTEALMKLALNSGRVVLKGMPLETLRGLSSDVQARLAKPPKEATEAQREQYLATATVWLTILSCRLQETALIESIMDQQSRTLNNSQSAMVHRCVGESMAEITRNEQARRSPSLDLFMEKCSKQVFHSGSYIKKKAHAWGMVGVLQGIGLPALARFGIMETLNKAATEKQNEKAGAMILLEVLCAVMGKTVEPYALSLVPFLLESVADADPKISECADDAARVMMSSLTAVGLRQLVPTLVAGLSCDQAKKRVPPLNFIGYVAFCSPKQLAAALPEIMKHITPCLFDVNGSVTVAAFNALRRVAGVVSNPEIQEHVELILNAMRNPSSDTENALDALLYTRFVNVVDPASLALIIPVISRGLSGQVAHTRPKAAQIVASMVSLVGDAKTLQPYAEELVKLLESAAQDPLTEARTTAAKAVGALASAVGGDFIDMVATWCFGVLQKTQTGAIEKAGAAQVFVELVSSCGYELLVAFLSTIEAGMTDERPPIREGFLYIMVYAPSTLRTEDFQQLLPLAFPWVLDGLSHFSDKVRDVALGAGDSIISLYGTRNLPLVLKPLLEGVANEITTMRQSSLLLSSKLMLHLVASIKKKMRLQLAQEAAAADEGADGGGMAMDPLADEEGGGVLTMEAARDVEKRGISILGSLEEMLGTDSLVRMLSAIYCGRHEHSLNVRTDCNMAWQACVASIRAAVGKIFDALVQLLTHFCSSDNPDCVEVAEKSIEFTTRMNETIERFINVFCDNYKSEHHRTKLGSLTALGVVVQYADSKRLMSMGGQIVGCVLPGMQDESDAVKDAARIVFARVTKSVGSRLIEGAVEAQISTSVRGVVEVVKVKPSIALALVFKHLNELTEYSESNVELIDCILDVEEAEEELEHYDEDITRILLACAVQGIATTSEVAQRFFDSLPEDREAQPLESFHKALNVPRTRLGALILAEAYGLGASLANLDGIEAVFRAAIDALGDAAEDSRAQAVATITGLISSLEQRVVDELAEEEQGDVTVSKRAAGRYLIQFLEVFQVALASTASACMSSSGEEHFAVLGEGEPRLFDVLMALYNRGLDYGTATQKVEAVECIQDLMRFAPRAISATASNTVAGRCSKVLFTRNEGSVVLALVRLCLQLMDYPASGKEKMVEGTMALAVYNAALCDSGEARALALRIVISLLKRSEKYADLILGTVVTKRAAADSPLLRTVMCRFISVVMRYANFEKSFPHIIKLMEVVRPMWESPTSPAQAVAAGVAVGALAKSASVPDDVLRDIKERTLALTAVKGVQALAGYALVYSLLNAAPARADQTFLEVAAEQVSLAAGYASDKLSTLWVLRAAGAIATTGCISQANFRIETYVPLLRRLGGNNEEQSLSTAQYFFDCVSGAYPSMYNSLDSFGREPSALWQIVGHFDADLDDEVVADTVM